MSDGRSAQPRLLGEECDLFAVKTHFLARCQGSQKGPCVLRLSPFVPWSARIEDQASLPGPRVVAGQASFRIRTTCHMVTMSISLVAGLPGKRRDQ